MNIELALFASLVFLLGNAFFVGAEFSMVSVRRSAIEPDAARGSKRAIATLKALENISLLMAGAQLGITLCSLALGAVAEPTLAHFLDTPLHALGVSHDLLHPISFAIALVITVFAHVVIGEMVPKNIALAGPEKTAVILTPALVYVVKVISPVVHGLNFIANSTLRLFNVRPRAEVSSAYTRDEVADLVKESRREGYLSEDNEQLLSGALTFDKQTVKDIAMPVDQMISVTMANTYGQIEDLAARTGFSRFPVVGRKSRILGYVHIKDIIKVDDKKRSTKLHPRDIRKLVVVSSHQSIRMTLKIMQHSGAHIALVQQGKKILGLVALADVLEELVGEMSEQNIETVDLG